MVNESCTAGFTSNSGLDLSFHGLNFFIRLRRLLLNEASW